MYSHKKNLKYLYLFMVLSLVSCYAYAPYIVTHRSEKNNSSAPSSFGKLLSGEDALYQWKTSSNKELNKYKIKKYFAFIKPESPVGRINSEALECVKKNMIYEAEILLLEALLESPGEPALYNNLGIVYEATGKETEAFTMYSRACMIDQDNLYFRKNLLTLYDYEKE